MMARDRRREIALFEQRWTDKAVTPPQPLPRLTCSCTLILSYGAVDFGRATVCCWEKKAAAFSAFTALT